MDLRLGWQFSSDFGIYLFNLDFGFFFSYLIYTVAIKKLTKIFGL